MFCRHKWKMVSETVTKSQWEVFIDTVQGVIEGVRPDLSRKHIQIVSCEKCGKLHRFVENI